MTMVSGAQPSTSAPASLDLKAALQRMGYAGGVAAS